MADEERTGSCIICTERDPLPDLEPVCGPCRSRLAGQLRDIPQLVDELRGEVPADVTTGEERIEERADHLVEVGDQLAAVVRVEHRHLVDVHAGAVPGQSSAPRVHRSREAPVPISVDRTDLLSAARSSTSSTRPLAYPEQDDDQIGYLSVATVLDGWCRDLAETRRETTPAPAPAIQCRYLLDRLDWAFTDHPAVDELAKEISDLWHVLRRAAGLTTPQPELCEGVPCKSIDCDLRSLYRLAGADYVECASCSRLYTASEYADWVRLVAAAAAKGRKAS